MVNWGIIAAGGIAKRRTLPAMEAVENARVIAVMDKNEEVAKNLSIEYEIPYVYQNEEELLEMRRLMQSMWQVRCIFIRNRH